MGNNRCPCGLDFSSILPDKMDQVLLQCQQTMGPECKAIQQNTVQTEGLRCNGVQSQELLCTGAARMEGTEPYKCNDLQRLPEELPRESNVSPEEFFGAGTGNKLVSLPSA